jgi:uncharacterized membrane protein YhiD involved in acid resistance
MFKGFESVLFNQVTLEAVLVNLTMALICGLLISLFYRYSYNGPNYSPSFVQATIALSMVTALVIMVIGNNLARAFGLVGAMSIIRFRTAVKDVQDIVFIFFALAAGMAAGVGLRLVAFGGTLFIGTILLVLSKTGFGRPRQYDLLLQFDCRFSPGNEDPRGDEHLYLPLLSKYCSRYKLINIQGLNHGDNFEMSFYIRLKDPTASGQLAKELQRVPEISRVHLYHEENQESI